MTTTGADPLVGKLVSHYEITAKLGGGGMGIVYAAKDTRLGRLVALKFLPPQWSHDDSAKQRFIREAQAASSTDHRNICTIHNIETTDDGQLFIVMAHYEGETLKQRLERGALGVEEAVDIAAQIAEGLAKAHAQGVVHRDIKPGNLMVTEDAVKILDFGLAKFADSLQLTIPGSTLGTVAYMAPEQARGEEADARSDIWALGVVLYQMLTGEVPFKGAYAEAISYAIRHDPPPPLNVGGREIPEGVERVVLRALEKEPANRFQSSRELARELRMLQGRTIPIELRTEPVPVQQPGIKAERRYLVRRRVLAGLVVLLASVVGGSLWIVWPVERIPIAVVPLANQTGERELDDYRLALTHALTNELMESPSVRVLPYARALQIVRRFPLSGTDLSSREALQALSTQSAASMLIVPTLIYENNAWRARVELRNSETATNVASYETASVVSSLPKETAYGLMTSLAQTIQEHFRTHGSWRAYARDTLRSFVVSAAQPNAGRLRTLDAMKGFTEGVGWFEELEYAAAERSFAGAASLDPGNPIPLAWRSRAALMMRQDAKAGEAAAEALRRVAPATPPGDLLFVTVASAEARRDFVGAETALQELVARYRDEPAWIAERAAFLDRRGRTADAIAAYHQALKLDERVIRPRLELCRLYSPSRLNEPTNAKEQGRIALMRYRELGNLAGEGQALWCLIDVLRIGGDDERREARQNAERALDIFKNPRYPYNQARAYYYVGLAAEAQGRVAEAAAFWEKSLNGAREVGNALLQPLLLMNLGVMYGRLGDRSRAADYYQESYMLYEGLGEEHRAAQNLANRAEVLIEYGGSPDEGLRDVNNALSVFQKLNDKNFEVFCRQILAAYYRNSGRHRDADRELIRALAIANERDLKDEIATLSIDRARLLLDMNDYGQALKLLLQALGDGLGPESTEARVQLGRVYVRLGDLTSAQREFSKALADLQGRSDSELLPALHLAMGELAYQLGQQREARTHFEEGAALWVDTLVAASSVEARAHVGLLDALEGRAELGRTAVQSSLEQARKMGQFGLETRCRLYLTRIFLTERRFKEALHNLDESPAVTSNQTIGLELQAQMSYWRARALAGLGDRAGAESEAAIAKKLVRDLQNSLPAQYRERFISRIDIRLLIR